MTRRARGQKRSLDRGVDRGLGEAGGAGKGVKRVRGRIHPGVPPSPWPSVGVQQPFTRHKRRNKRRLGAKQLKTLRPIALHRSPLYTPLLPSSFFFVPTPPSSLFPLRFFPRASLALLTPSRPLGAHRIRGECTHLPAPVFTPFAQ